MNIKSKPKNDYLVTVTVEEYGTMVQCDIINLKEAQNMREELMSVLNDLDTYIEKQLKKTQNHKN